MGTLFLADAAFSGHPEIHAQHRNIRRLTDTLSVEPPSHSLHWLWTTGPLLHWNTWIQGSSSALRTHGISLKFCLAADEGQCFPVYNKTWKCTLGADETAGCIKALVTNPDELNLTPRAQVVNGEN